MNRPTYRQVRNSKTPERLRPYAHRKGAFLLTASFRTEVDQALIQLAGKLAEHYTQKRIAELFGCSTSTVGKMVRCYFAQQSNYQVANGKP